jgi:outer membrane protein OmpA-like peptidoglycan-associated protein
MKVRGIFVLFILSSLGLISLYIYLFAKPLHLKRLEEERIANIQKVCMKKNPRHRDRRVLERNVLEADRKIQEILLKEPIYFDSAEVLIDNNSTMRLNQKRVTLNKIIAVLNNINEDVVMNIAAHTDKEGSSIKNLKLSQERADVLKEYFQERTHIVLITAIGYGEELPLPKGTKKRSNRRIEINLKRIK